MVLKAYILGQEYETVVQGNTFADEYNETLDSGTIIINGIPKIEDLRPYDDVFIYDSESLTPFTGYGNGVAMPETYYHLLVDQFSCEQLVLGSNLYKYTIQLFSETKGLETAQLPNISITQPLNASGKAPTINYIKLYLGMYSPTRKISVNKTLKTYRLERKYSLATTDLAGTNLKAPSNIFSANDFAPEMTLNDPNLRDVLTQLMLTKDCIPVVKDDVIYCLDISARNGTFDTSKGEINYVIGSRSSDNHCDNLKRTYQNALGQNNTCRYTEYLGFRNSDTGLMTLSNMRLETRFPIYKINKVLMCYYKRVGIQTTASWTNGTYYARNDKVMYGGECYICLTAHTSTSWADDSAYWDKYYIVFLCKQDITSLVLLNSYRNALSMDYDDIQNPSGSSVTDINDLAQYKFCTVGYDIGSKYITGWGTTYSQLNTTIPWFKHDKTYIENIFKNVDDFTPFGIYDYGYVSKLLNDNTESLKMTEYTGLGAVVVGNGYQADEAVKLKSFFFQIEYDGFYNGTVYHSKDGARDNVVMNDNASSSLTLLEKDGLFEKEKANRFGNEAIQINARYTSLNDIQPLGCVYGDDDIVIYHREYSIYNNVINCTYYGTKDYVLKNYFTSVYSKHRPFNLLAFDESTRRSENRKRFILLSKDKQYYQGNTYTTTIISDYRPMEDVGYNSIELYKTFVKTDFHDSLSIFSTLEGITKMLTCLSENDKATSKGVFPNTEVINSAFITGESNVSFKTDINKFVCGKSMCFNLTMYDNLGAGSSLKQIVPTNLEDIYNGLTDESALKLVFSNVQDDYTGSTTFYDSVYRRSNTSGRVNSVGFFVCHRDTSLTYDEEPVIGGETTILNNIGKDYLDGNQQSDESVAYGKYGLYRLPNVRTNWGTYANYVMYTTASMIKDNKEQLDMTFQIEPITNNPTDIFFSEWFMKLNNLVTNYHKTNNTYSVTDDTSFSYHMEVVVGVEAYDSHKYIPYVLVKIPVNDYNNINTGTMVVGENECEFAAVRANDFLKYFVSVNTPYIRGMRLTLRQLVTKNTSQLKFKIDRDIHWAKGSFNLEKHTVNHWDGYPLEYLTLNRVTDPSSKAYDINYYVYAWNFKDNTNSFSPPVDGLTITDDDFQVYTFDMTSTGYFFCMPNKCNNDNKYYLPIGATGISSANASLQTIYMASGTEITTTYNKNMYLAISDNKLELGDEEKAYSNSADIDGFNANMSVNDIFNVTDEAYFENINTPKRRPLIEVDLHNVPSTTRSISYYFHDIDNGLYHFVFGVNVTEEDIENGSMRIYLSDLITRDTRVFDSDTHLIIGNEKNYVGTTDEFPSADAGTGYYE